MTIPPAERYRRQLLLPEVGPAGQARLATAGALVVGAGGLGCAALPYLAAAGLRALTVCDGDRVEPSNLPRQVLYGDADLGRAKAAAAAARLAAQNRELAVTAVVEPLAAANAAALVAAADVVLDCTDDFAARFLLHDTCHAAGRPLVSAAVHHDEGQLAVFRFDRAEPGPCWRCLWPRPPAAARCTDAGADAGDGVGAGDGDDAGATIAGAAGVCGDQGILGTVPGLLGAWQADQALRIVLGLPALEPGRLLHVDVAALRVWHTNWTRAADCPLCGNLADGAGGQRRPRT